MRFAVAGTPPERHSLVPYSLFNELERFRSSQGQSSKGLPECQADFQTFFEKAGSQCPKWRNFCGIPKRGSKSDAFAAESTLPCSSTQTERCSVWKICFPSFRYSDFNQRGSSLPVEANLSKSGFRVKIFGRFFSDFRLQRLSHSPLLRASKIYQKTWRLSSGFEKFSESFGYGFHRPVGKHRAGFNDVAAVDSAAVEPLLIRSKTAVCI